MIPRKQTALWGFLCSVLLVTAGCGDSAPTASQTEKLNTAPPLESEESQPADDDAATAPVDTSDGENKTTAAANVDLQGMTFAAPADWSRNANPVFVEAEFALPGEDEDARLTIMKAGGDKQANIDRWVSQFQMAEGDKPSTSEIDVNGQTATVVDIRGTYMDQRPGKGPQENYRMLAYIIPFSATDNYFVKATGPKETVAKHEEAIAEFVKSGKHK